MSRIVTSILVSSGVSGLVVICTFVVAAPAPDWDAMAKVLLPALEVAGVLFGGGASWSGA